jgi:hypothetical protein
MIVAVEIPETFNIEKLNTLIHTNIMGNSAPKYKTMPDSMKIIYPAANKKITPAAWVRAFSFSSLFVCILFSM